MSDDEKVRREYRDSQRERLGLPLQETGGDKGTMSEPHPGSEHEVSRLIHADKNGHVIVKQMVTEGELAPNKSIPSATTLASTPDPIAFDHTSVLKILFDHHNGYVPPRETDEITIQELLKLHNQSLQTAVTQARIDELKRVVEQLPGEHTNHGIRIGVAEAYHVLEIVIEARIAELTKAKEVNNV